MKHPSGSVSARRGLLFLSVVVLALSTFAIGAPSSAGTGCRRDWNESEGKYYIYGDSGDNSCVGSSYPDVMYGYEGSDFLRGGPGNDDIYGGRGDDILKGEERCDYLHGGDGADNIHGGGNSVIQGIGCLDVGVGKDGADDWYEAAHGDDNDEFYGGEGSDWVDTFDGDHRDWATLESGNDRCGRANDGDTVLFGADEGVGVGDCK
jgi:RTX calcium-binding nonapeptide repeat (4 copies)